MKIINVRELRSAIPHLAETLEAEHEILLVSNGEAIARILPVESAPRLQSLKWLRERIGQILPDSTDAIRDDRDRRGT